MNGRMDETNSRTLSITPLPVLVHTHTHTHAHTHTCSPSPYPCGVSEQETHRESPKARFLLFFVSPSIPFPIPIMPLRPFPSAIHAGLRAAIPIRCTGQPRLSTPHGPMRIGPVAFSSRTLATNVAAIADFRSDTRTCSPHYLYYCSLPCADPSILIESMPGKCSDPAYARNVQDHGTRFSW